MAGEVTVLQLQNAALDAQTLAQIAMVGYAADTTTNRDGDTLNTVQGQLKLLGYIPPIAYAGAISFGALEGTKTVERLGIVYAPVVSSLPFTTSGTWVGSDDAKFVVVQVGSVSAADISASVTGYPAFWTNTTIQQFMDYLVKGNGLNSPVFKVPHIFNSGSGDNGYFAQSSWGIGYGDGNIDTQNLLDTLVMVCTPATGSATGAWDFIIQNDDAYINMYGATSGSNPVVKFKKASGYIATINATGVQQKVAEWDNVAFKATKAFQLPTYANLAAINASITAPVAGMLCYVTGQGMAIYKASWVRTTDETTAIT